MTGQLHFIYFADPMCSWCWGFSPVIGQLRATYGAMLPIRPAMGGLRPGTTEPMSEEAKAITREHWQHVHEASGQAFDFAFFDRAGFVYDTDPAARAVVAARRRGLDIALDFLDRAHAGFYAEGRDITKAETLVDLAAELGLDPTAFAAEMQSDDVRNETWSDYAISQRAGVTGFPTLVLGPGPDGRFLPVTRGFQPADQVLAIVRHYLARLAEHG